MADTLQQKSLLINFINKRHKNKILSMINVLFLIFFLRKVNFRN